MYQGKFRVKYMKHIVEGPLKGIAVDADLGFETLDAATKHAAWCLKHMEKPVEAIGGGNYTCHVIRIVPVEVVNG